jgi:hypothetical protein
MLQFLRNLLGRSDGDSLAPEWNPEAAAKLRALPPEERPWQSESAGELRYDHRTMVTLRPKQPIVHWLQRNLGQGHANLATARRADSLGLLRPPFLSTQEIEDLVRQHWPRYFAQMLEPCEADPDRWPTHRSWAMFQQWFDIESCEAIIDIAPDIGELWEEEEADPPSVSKTPKRKR